MKLMKLLCLAGLLAGLAVTPAIAESHEDDGGVVEETIVVTASRTEQRLHEVPAAITVLSDELLEQIPADNLGDVLRNAPGVNVSQTSARDISVTSRGATNTLATSQLVLMDNRTLYLDFFGFVMWDFVPLDPNELKQIEVVNGPGSAVWGANAMTGVINLITKSPREMQGTSVTIGGGEFSTLYGGITHAGATDKMGYKISGSYYEQDPFDRPTGIIPGSRGPTNPLGTPYPPFENQGTSQPKFNFRLDWDSNPGTLYGFSGGYAGTDGIIHTGIGPFDINTGSQMSFVKFDYQKQAHRFTFFANYLDGDAENLLTVGEDLQPIQFFFESTTYDLDYSNTKVFGTKNILTYGVKARRNEYDLSIAPRGDERDEYGVFIQDEILFSDKWRWLIGARWDDIDPIGSVVSPRTTLMYSPTDTSTWRVSWNRAFRSPSLINNFLDVTIISGALVDPRLIAAGIAPGVPCEFVLTTCTPFFQVLPIRAFGNPLLTEEQMDAIELGYVGTFANGVTFTFSIYENETTDSTDFFTAGHYSPVNPPPGWPVFILGTPIPAVPPGVFPNGQSYRNIGEIVDTGVEISISQRPRNSAWSYFLNYSWQDEPEVTGIELETLPNGTDVLAIGIPPEHRANLGLAYDGSRYFFNSTVNYVDEAFWTDVLDARFWGPTDSYTVLNIGLGVHFGDSTFTINGTNVTDEDMQQHIFGDIIARKVTGQIIFRF